MAASKPEVLRSQLVDGIGTKFQRLHPCFRGPATPVWRPLSSASDFRFGRTAFRLLALSCWTPETKGVSRWNFVTNSLTRWDIITSGLEAAILDFRIAIWSHSIETTKQLPDHRVPKRKMYPKLFPSSNYFYTIPGPWDPWIPVSG
jgi:hypothetical protein